MGWNNGKPKEFKKVKDNKIKKYPKEKEFDGLYNKKNERIKLENGGEKI